MAANALSDRLQAIAWTNDDPFHIYMYVSSVFNQLKH